MSANDPAFPGNEDWMYSGITKKEYFAGLVMQGIMSVGNGTGSWNSRAQIDAAAQDAVKAADALIKVLEESK